MIVYPASLVLSAGTPLRNPRIGHQSYTIALPSSAVVVSSEAVGRPKDAPLSPDTAEYWQPLALPATWLLDLGQNCSIDYVGLVHNLGTLGCSVGVAQGITTDFAPRMTVPGVAGNWATTPDSAVNSVTGDIDIRAKVQLADWTPAAIADIVIKSAGAPQQSYNLRIRSSGVLVMEWSNDGTTVLNADSTVATGVADGSTKWVRATLDVDNGAAGKTASFFLSDDGITWTPLGAPVTTGGTTSIFNGTAALQVGSTNLGVGAVYYADVRNVINGAIVAKFDPADGVTDGLSFVSSSPSLETWTINRAGATPARLINPRFGGTADVLPGDDSPLMFLDTQTVARYVQISIAGVAPVAMPKIFVVYVGVALAVREEIEGRGFSPLSLSRKSELVQSMSRGGQFLNQGFRRTGVSGNASFKLLESSWYRSNFDAFVKNARRYPYFFAWCPQDYPRDIGYVWTDKDIVPRHTGTGPWLEVSWPMQGIGND